MRARRLKKIENINLFMASLTWPGVTMKPHNASLHRTSRHFDGAARRVIKNNSTVRILAADWGNNTDIESIQCENDGFKTTVVAESGTTCECSGLNLTFECSTLSTCEEIPSCSGPVCSQRRITGQFAMFDTAMYVEYIEVETHLTSGAPYDGFRFYTDSISCEHYVYFKGLEYKCKSCELCLGQSAATTGAMLDCSNIQQGAATNLTCFDAANLTSDVRDYFSVCPKGGATTPKTAGSAIGLESDALAHSASAPLFSASTLIGLATLGLLTLTINMS